MLGGSWGGAVAKLKIAYLPDLESIVFGLAVALLSGLLVLSGRPINNRRFNFYNYCNQILDLVVESNRKNRIFLGSVFMERALWVAVILIALYAWHYELSAGPMFFGIGALVLGVGLFSFYKSTQRSSACIATEKNNPLLDVDMNRGRKGVVVGILAVGSFLVIGAGAFRHPPMIDSQNLKSGTGGFSHIVETSLPLL